MTAAGNTEQKNRIELDALRKQREAEAQAKALKEIAAAEAEAALKQADTLRTQAQAEAEASKLRAEGTKATSSAVEGRPAAGGPDLGPGASEPTEMPSESRQRPPARQSAALRD